MFAAEEIGFECSGFSASADAKTEVAFAESTHLDLAGAREAAEALKK
jgi:hypothetical protein